MKKLILLAFAFVISVSLFAQEFLGVKVDGKKSEVIQQFKQKGFTVKGDDSKDIVTLIGDAGGKTVDLLIISSPTTQTVWKFAVYLPQRSTWSSLKGEYQDFLEMLSTKYGKPEKTYQFFSSPYDEGDGYEMTGVSIGKSNYISFWPEDQGITLEISKTKQVRIAYENGKNYEISKQESDALKKAAF